jgi:hypothetical protein
MKGKFISKKQMKIIDGDGRYEACTDQYLKNRLHDLLSNSLNFRVLQIFHYAGIHYASRWNSYPLRYINAMINCFATISNSSPYFCLNNNEEHELQGDTSEVLGVGFSNMFMCKWYNLNINRIEKIQGTGKRCDYRFSYNGNMIVFESKGRTRKSDIKSALTDCIIKKTNYPANIRYSLILHLPRDGSATTLNLYDPPSDDDILLPDEYFLIIKHYAKMSELAGLTYLAEKLRARIESFLQKREWDTTPIEFDNVLKIGRSIQIDEYNHFWTRQDNRNTDYQNNHMSIRFALHERVIELLKNWNIEELLRFTIDEKVIDDKVSILSDGSLFTIEID